MIPENRLTLYMHRFYREERVKYNMHDLDIVGEGLFLPPTVVIIVLEGRDIGK